jgi:hypothetical protein
MRKCPECSFENDDAFPTCVWCNSSLATVVSVVPANPTHPDYARSVAQAERWRLLGKKYRFAGLLYAAVIAVTAVIPGFVFEPGVIALYFASGAIVALGANTGFIGQLSGGVVQGALSLALLAYFGPYQPFIFFMLALHIILAGVMWHWMTMIADTHR